MNEDDINEIALALHDWLVADGGGKQAAPDYDRFEAAVHDQLDKFITRERNFN